MQKIVKIIIALISVAGIVSLVRIVAAGDDAIKSGEEAGLVDPMAWIGYITLGAIVVLVVLFVLKNLVTNPAGLKNTLIGVGVFAVILVIAYVVSDTENPIMQDGKPLYKYGDKAATSNEIQMSGGGLVAFYVLMGGAALAMIASSLKKMISK